MRKLVAALACRAQGSRLYGKPLQLLDMERNLTVIEHIVAALRTTPEINEIVLAVSTGAENERFYELAEAMGIPAIRGDERDVLERLILAGRRAGATDVFRVTTESPFTHLEPLSEVWRLHQEHDNDVTAIDGVPEGAHFEIYKLAALETSHARGDARHRSEMCSLYVREHRDEFRVEIVPVAPEVQRVDLRLTIDYPEDLVICRHIYARLRHQAPRVALTDIIRVLDEDEGLRNLVAPFVYAAPVF